MAAIGAAVFPRSIFDTPLQLSKRGEYEITDYVSMLAARQPVQVVEAKFWFPIGTVEVWQQAQQMNLEQQLRPRS